MQKENTENYTEIYKTILEQEISNHTIFITVLLGIVVILLGATWWWNKSGATKEIKDEVEKRFEKEKKKLLKELELKLQNKVDEEIKNYKDKILTIEADVARSMAISARKDEYYSHSVYWWSKHLKSNLELNNYSGIRAGTEWLIKDLDLIKETDEKNKLSTIHECEFIEETVSELPALLQKEKKIIMEICKGRKINN
jgi:hypothetical protein